MKWGIWIGAEGEACELVKSEENGYKGISVTL